MLYQIHSESPENCHFHVFTIFSNGTHQAYQTDGRVIMKGCVQWLKPCLGLWEAEIFSTIVENISTSANPKQLALQAST